MNKLIIKYVYFNINSKEFIFSMLILLNNNSQNSQSYFLSKYIRSDSVILIHSLSFVSLPKHRTIDFSFLIYSLTTYTHTFTHTFTHTHTSLKFPHPTSLSKPNDTIPFPHLSSLHWNSSIETHINFSIQSILCSDPIQWIY